MEVEDGALVGASVAGVGAAIAGGAALVFATGGVLPVALMAGGSSAKVMTDQFKHIMGKRRNSIHQELNFDSENKEGNG